MGEPAVRYPVRAAVAALAILSLIWGYNWVVMKQALQDAGPFTFAALRTGLGALALFLVLPFRGGAAPPADLRGTALLGLLQTSLFLGFTFWALVAGGAGRTAVLVYTMPLWVLVLGRLFLGERLARFQLVAVGVALAGLLLIIQPWSLAGSPLSRFLALLAGGAWGASVIVAKRMQRREAFDLLSVTAWQMLFGSLPLILAAVVIPEPPVRWTPYLIGALAFNVVLANAVAWLLWLYVIRNLPAWAAGFGSLVVPVVGVLAAWIELGERPGMVDGAGMLLIGSAMWLLILGGMKGKR